MRKALSFSTVGVVQRQVASKAPISTIMNSRPWWLIEWARLQPRRRVWVLWSLLFQNFTLQTQNCTSELKAQKLFLCWKLENVICSSAMNLALLRKFIHCAFSTFTSMKVANEEAKVKQFLSSCLKMNEFLQTNLAMIVLPTNFLGF